MLDPTPCPACGRRDSEIDEVVFYKSRCEALDDALDDHRHIVTNLRTLLERIAYAVQKGNQSYAASTSEKALAYLKKNGLQSSIIRTMDYWRDRPNA